MIPKIIHYCWFGGNPIPPKVHKCIDSWRRYCPDYQIICWNESNYDITAHPYTQQAYAHERWAFVSDVARLDVVYRHGGIYLDTDVELIRPLDSLLELDAFFALEHDMSLGYVVATGLGFGAKAGHPMIGALLTEYEQHNFEIDGRVNLSPTAHITHKVFASHGVVAENQTQSLDGMKIFSTEYFCPQDYATGVLRVTDRTYSIHHYYMSWKTAEEVSSSLLYLRMTRLFGNTYGEYICALINSLKLYGLRCSVKKIIGRLLN